MTTKTRLKTLTHSMKTTAVCMLVCYCVVRSNKLFTYPRAIQVDRDEGRGYREVVYERVHL